MVTSGTGLTLVTRAVQLEQRARRGRARLSAVCVPVYYVCRPHGIYVHVRCGVYLCLGGVCVVFVCAYAACVCGVRVVCIHLLCVCVLVGHTGVVWWYGVSVLVCARVVFLRGVMCERRGICGMHDAVFRNVCVM